EAAEADDVLAAVGKLEHADELLLLAGLVLVPLFLGEQFHLGRRVRRRDGENRRHQRCEHGPSPVIGRAGRVSALSAARHARTTDSPYLTAQVGGIVCRHVPKSPAEALPMKRYVIVLLLLAAPARAQDIPLSKILVEGEGWKPARQDDPFAASL